MIDGQKRHFITSSRQLLIAWSAALERMLRLSNRKKNHDRLVVSVTDIDKK